MTRGRTEHGPDMMRWKLSPQTHRRLRRIIGALGFDHIDPARIFCVRGYGSTSSAWARIWGLPSLWQQVLGTPAAYVIEVIEPEFSRLSRDDQDRVLIHELLHIPRTFSGAVRPHRTSTFRITPRTVERYYQRYLTNAVRGGMGSLPTSGGPGACDGRTPREPVPGPRVNRRQRGRSSWVGARGTSATSKM